MTLLSVYIYLVAVITVLSRVSNPSIHINTLIPFGTMHNDYRSQKWAIENIILFIPYGVFLKLLFREKIGLINVILIAALSSLTIETTQLITGRGNFEVDDIMTNSLGAVVGFTLCTLAIGLQLYWSRDFKEQTPEDLS
jgi:glycopeptide antibiotics resistance protein